MNVFHYIMFSGLLFLLGIWGIFFCRERIFRSAKALRKIILPFSKRALRARILRGMIRTPVQMPHVTTSRYSYVLCYKNSRLEAQGRSIPGPGSIVDACIPRSIPRSMILRSEIPLGCQRRLCSTRPRQTVFWGLSFYIYLTSFVNFYTLLHPIVSRLVLWCIISVIGLNVCDLLEFNKFLTTQGFSINSIFAGFWLTFSWPLKCAFSVYPITLELVFVNYILLKSQRVKDYFIESYGVELLKKRGLNPSASLFRTVMTKMSQITAAAVGFHTVGKIVEGNYYWSSYEMYLKEIKDAREAARASGGDISKFLPEPPKKKF